MFNLQKSFIMELSGKGQMAIYDELVTKGRMA